MNVNLKVLGVGALFFIGGTAMLTAQKRDTATKTRDIDEVVVVGYGTQKKSEVTGAITQVKGDDLKNLVTPSFDQQLSGRASGVQVTQNSGLLGQAPRFRIRGVNSINSSTYPLVVVDGLPINTGDLGGYAANNALADINPNDIESMEVLKDGAATAIYGSRAANGVVLITTKKGKQGRTTFNYNTYLGVAETAKYFDLLKTADFITINNEKRTNRGQAAVAFGDAYDTNWQKAVLRSAAQMDHNFNFSGGLGKGSYYASFGYTKQEGIIRANDLERFSARLNADQKVGERFKVGLNLGVTRTITNGLNVGESSLSGAMFNVIRQLPNTPVFDPSGPYGYNIDVVGSNTIVGRAENAEHIANNLPNIRFVLDNNIYRSATSRIIGSGYGEYKFFDWLSLRSQVSVDRNETLGLLFWHPFHGDGVSTNGRVQNNTDISQTYNWQNVLTVNKSFGGHNFVLTGVNEYQQTDRNGFMGGGTNLADAFFKSNVFTGTYSTPLSFGYRTANSIVSYLGRLNYDFGKRYFISASLRKDIMSKFAPEVRSEVFPGVSAGWTVSNENFFEGAKSVVSDFKLRGSWGRTGNFNVFGGDFPYYGAFSPRKYGDYNGLAFARMGNPLLTWEVLEKSNVGLDLSLLRNRIKFTVDYYINDANRLVDRVQTPASLGVPDNRYISNIGNIRNRGWEFSLDSEVVRTDNFSLNISANLTLNNNEVLELANGADQISTYNIIREGLPINSLYGVRYWGVNMANGNPVYYKNDGTLVQANLATNRYVVYDPANPSNVTQAATAPDLTVLGNTLPTYFGAFNVNMKYKGFDFGTLIRFSGGNKIMNVTRKEMLSQNFNNNSAEILGRWQSVDNPGDGWTPRLWAAGDPIVNGPTVANSRFVEKGDFVKFDNITLGYNFSKDTISAIGLKSLRVFAQAQNAIIITKYTGADPELEIAGVDYNVVPRSRVFSVGLNVGF
ncbi:putative outer membrane protein [Bergeyella porcorum]|uniref:Outer membrane protein n=1 Tax=Bergeyella porcorum TaxID=1735111 RepID=A0AAU0F3R6_9FLAO